MKAFKSKWAIGDRFRIVEIVKGKRALASSMRFQGFWLGDPSLTYAVCEKEKPTELECEACGRPTKLNRNGHCEPCARWAKTDHGRKKRAGKKR